MTSHHRPAFTTRRTRPLAWACLAAAGLLAACTTVDDYRRMTPEQRAERVCARNVPLRELDAAINQTRSMIGDTELALHRGYRVHQQCRRVELPDNVTRQCTTTQGPKGQTQVCKEEREERSRKECTDTVITIDRALEETNHRSYLQRLAQLQAQRTLDGQRCFDRAVRMTPEEAFSAR